jgi:hypothetical protein
MLATFHKFLDYIKFGISQIYELPIILRGLRLQFQDHLKLIKYNIANLREANIALAHHHMKLGNLSDVILRCFIITKFINREDKEAYNLMAAAYYLKGDIVKAQKKMLLAGDFADEGFQKFIQNPKEEIEEIPIEIFAQYRDHHIDHYIEDKDGIYTTISKKLIGVLFENLDELDENFAIVEVNSAAGAAAEAIKERAGKNIKVSLLEYSEKMREYLSHSDISYDKILDLETKDKYDVIVSVLGLEYSRNLSTTISSLQNLSKKNALIALALRVSESEKTYLNKERNAFIYAHDFIISELDVADFEIIAIKEIVISANKYALIVCSKK